MAETNAVNSDHDARNKARRLADIRRGTKNYRQLEMLQDRPTNKRRDKHHEGGNSFSATRNPKPVMALESRHSCPTLPVISSSSIISKENFQSDDSRGLGRKSSPVDEAIKPMAGEVKNTDIDKGSCVKINVESFHKFDTNCNGKNSDPENIDLLTTRQAQSIRDKHTEKNKVTSTNIRQNCKCTGCAQKNCLHVSLLTKTPTNQFQIESDVSTDNRGEDVSRTITSTKCKGSEYKQTHELFGSPRTYSVLLNGGTLAKQVPYTDRLKTTPLKLDSITKNNDGKPTTDVVGQSDGRLHDHHLRYHSELFAFQQDLLLPRYRKLAGIHRIVGEDELSDGDGRGGKAPGRPDARKVFEKISHIIKGPDKEVASKNISNEGNMSTSIYLASGLPCGYIDSSRKCDAWLFENFDE